MKKGRYQEFRKALAERVLVLDGSLGVQIHRLLTTGGGNVDFLNITDPATVARVHHDYLAASADIIETNTFNSNRLSQSGYGLEERVRDLNLRGAEIARGQAAAFEEQNPSRMRFVAGSIGPTAASASLPNDVENASKRAVDFDTLRRDAAEQAGALIDGGVDLLLLETCFDALNIKAQLCGVKEAMDQRGLDVPVVVSMTLSDASGRLLSGHTPEAVLTIIENFNPAAVGFNCGAGPESLVPHLRRLASVSKYPTIFYPNAGLPDRLGNYSQTAESFSEYIKPLLDEGLLNIVGGCCGTDPTHIAAIAGIARNAVPHRPSPTPLPWLAGMEEFHDDRGFINVGERCNVAGSRKFLRLIKEGNADEALTIARKQVKDGAMALDINLDDGMLDSGKEMVKFLRLLGSDPLTSSLPWMIDSSRFDVIEAALRNVAGKPIVNSISLKHGEQQFIEEARIIHGYGAAVVVMAFDEEGQADTLQRRTEICARAYRLLTEKAGFAPRDIIFDPNVLTVATGMPEHDRYALDFIEAVRWIKRNLPGAKTSGGVSNLSFAFRGNNFVRQAMHAVFLYHAIEAGLDMAIMDPGAKVIYNDIPAELLEAIEDVILCRRPDASERLTAMAGNYAKDAVKTEESLVSDVPEDVDERLCRALMSGNDVNLEPDLMESVDRHRSANAVVEGPLMAGMERVGKLFETGRMFLPQVVKSARVMHRAVEILKPLLEADSAKGSVKGLVLMATVKGDVHDIGKNISAVVMRCNNFEVVDLGVQVDAETIVKEARRLNPDFIGLSGLISPSLDEMANVATELQRAGLRVPLLLGGAATSDLHTAVKIAPLYDGIVLRVSDAAQNPVAASRILADPEGEAERIRKHHEELRNSIKSPDDKDSDHVLRADINWEKEALSQPAVKDNVVIKDIPLGEIRPFINWIYFHLCWKTPADSPEGRDLRKDAEALLDSLEKENAVMWAQTHILAAYGDSAHNRIVVDGTVIETPRQYPKATREELLSLSDFVAPEGYNDHVGVFMATIGDVLRDKLDQTQDEYSRLLLQSVCDRLAEATSEWMHYKVRTEIWGYSPDEPLDIDAISHARYRGIRPAVGYPSLPDQMQMHGLVKLIDPAALDVEVTSNGALSPSSTVAGFYLASPRAKYFTV